MLVYQEMMNIDFDRPSLGVGFGQEQRNVSLMDWIIPDPQELQGMLEIFNVQRGVVDFLTFVGGSFIVILFSTTLSLFSIIFVNPKKILLQAKIQ